MSRHIFRFFAFLVFVFVTSACSNKQSAVGSDVAPNQKVQIQQALRANVQGGDPILNGTQSATVELSGGSGSYFTYNGCFVVGVSPGDVMECNAISADSPNVTAERNLFTINIRDAIDNGTVKDGDIYTFTWYDTNNISNQVSVDFTAQISGGTTSP